MVESVFPNLAEKYDYVQWLKSRAILAPINSRLQSLNSEVAKIFPHDFSYYRSADSVAYDSVEAQNSAELRYPVELLNLIEVGASLPYREIALKKGFIVMLLPSIMPSSGHVNGTRYVVDNLTPNVIFLTSVSGSKTGERPILPRMNCTVSKDDFPIPGFRRSQFPVRICFAMTINKAQGQSIPRTLGIDLHGPCFSRGQLYVALSRTTDPRNVFILTTDGSNRTKNVVFSELFGMRQIVPRVRNSVVPKHLTPKVG